MTYGYNIIRSGVTIPLTQVFAGYNAGGTTSGFNGMGSFTSVISNYRKQNPVGFQQNGNDLSNIYEAPYIVGSVGSTTYITVPNGCTSARGFLIGGGGGAGGGAGYVAFGDLISGGGGGGGASICFDITVSAGSTISLYVGGGGGGASASNNGGGGGNSSITYNGQTWTAGGGGGGPTGDNNYMTVGGNGGVLYLPYNGYTGSYFGMVQGADGIGNTPNNYGLSYYDGSSRGGRSNIINGNFDVPFTNVGFGGNSHFDNGDNGNNGYGSVHFLY